MTIKCEIETYKDTEIFNSGDIVSGLIKYDIEEETAYDKIIVSLKGNGYLIVKQKEKGDNVYTQRKSEDYVDIDYIIYKKENGEKLRGWYEREYNFMLPKKIPSSLKLVKKTPKHHIYCQIVYYIRIKFQKAGIVNKIQKFQKRIIVNSVVEPRLPSEPTAYGDQKILSQFSWKRNILKMNAVVDKSVRMSGDKIKIDYEIFNDTNFNIKGVIVKLIESYIFKASRRKVTIVEDVKGTDSRTNYILHGRSDNRCAEISVPEFLNSIEYCGIISREYFINVTLELPKHRKDVHFKIPIQITNDRPPPAYWEVLQENNDEQLFFNEGIDEEIFSNSEDDEETTNL